MKRRSIFSSRHFLFAFCFACFWLVCLAGGTFAQDRLVYKDGRTQDTKILGVSGAAVQIQVGAGSIGIPLATVASVFMAPPADLAAANAAYRAGDYAKALPLAKAIADKYKGLPTDWARQATSLVGDIQVGLGNLQEAEAAYKSYQSIYPGAGTPQTDVGLARIDLARKNYDAAKAKLEPITAAALKEKTPNPAFAPIYGQAFFLLGQIAEAQSKTEIALENYLLAVTLFYADRSAAASAQEKANALRKKDPTLSVP